MIESPIRLVCFDLGGVLIRICRSWAEGVAKAGLPLRPNGSDLSGDSVSGWHELVFQHQTGALTATEYANRVSGAMKCLYSPDEVLAVHHAWMYGEYKGVGDVIDRIHEAGLPTACLSNTNHAHWEQLLHFPTIKKLKHRFASHELRLHKPDRAIFREFERRVNVEGPQILYFDDLPENVEAAKSVGWAAILIDPGGEPARQILVAFEAYVRTI